MNDKPSEQKRLDSSAETALKQYAKDYAAAILINARMVAFRDNAEKVKRSHIEEAIETINRGGRRTFWSESLLLTLGGAFFGAFIQGFITEISNGNTPLVVVYVILGFVGVTLVFWGLNR